MQISTDSLSSAPSQNRPVDFGRSAGLSIVFYILSDKEDVSETLGNLLIETGVGRVRETWEIAHDTKIVQWIINHEDEDKQATEAWGELCKRVKDAYDKKDQLKSIWTDLNQQRSEKDSKLLGYTLLFLAEHPLDQLGDKEASLFAIKEAIKYLFERTADYKIKSYESSKDSGGQIHLIGKPDVLHISSYRAMIYVNYSPKEEQKSFVKKVLVGGNAKIIYYDLTLHKAYYQRFQYEIQRKNLENIADSLTKAAEYVIDCKSEHRKDDVKDKIERISEVATRIQIIAYMLYKFQDSIKQQQFNFRNISSYYQLEGITSHHEKELEEILFNLELLIGRCDRLCLTTSAATGLASNRQSKFEEKGNQKRDKLVATIGVAMAIPQLVDSSAALSIIQFLVALLRLLEPQIPFGLSAWLLFRFPILAFLNQNKDMFDRLAGLALQVVLILFFAWILRKYIDMQQGE